jgi:hypothetical protein
MVWTITIQKGKSQSFSDLVHRSLMALKRKPRLTQNWVIWEEEMGLI